MLYSIKIFLFINLFLDEGMSDGRGGADGGARRTIRVIRSKLTSTIFLLTSLKYTTDMLDCTVLYTQTLSLILHKRSVNIKTDVKKQTLNIV